MGKSNLLIDAIADAKAVRETALANARMRMEEAFTPRLQSMISAKLKNEVEGDDEDENVVDAPEVEEPKAEEPEVEEPEVEEPAVEEPEVEEPEAEAPAVEEPVDTQIEEPVEVDAEPDSDVNIEVEPEVKPEDEDEVEEEGYELDLESIIKELEDESDMEDEVEEPVFESSDEDIEDIEDVEELEEGENTDEGMKNDTDVTPDLTGETGPTPGTKQESPDRGKPFSTEKGGELKPDATMKQNPKNAIYEEEDEEDVDVDDDEEEINLDEIIKELEEADLSASVPEQIPDASNPFKSMNEQLQNKVAKLSKDLREHRQVIKFLKSKLNEVNLLNAKLLFTSKLFKANNLNNTQKMKVIESFDRAKTLREVKLVYSTIAESFGNARVEKPVKKSVKSITEQINSGASKPVASTKPSKIITESIVSEDGAERLKKLAGIKNKK